MAQMIPPVPKSFDEKSEEGIVFYALKNKLPDDYFVFHSVSPATVDNGTFYEREIDFVIANAKKGILCIEAKNGTGISYDGRCWKYGSGTPMEHDGPYHQVATAKRTLRSKIANHANPKVRELYDKCKVMHAVFFFKMSTVDFQSIVEQGLPEEADARITMLAEDLQNPTRKIADIFSISLPHEKYVTETKLTEEEFQLLLDSVLCPTFHMVPSPAADNVAMILNMNQLLHEQYRLLDYLEDQNTAVINGAAGTGKTMLAVEKAHRHSKEGERVLFLCYNRLLCDKLVVTHKQSPKKAYREEFKNVEFKTLSQLTKEVTGNYKDYEGLEEWLIECSVDPDKFGYKHVIVDEGQDFGLPSLSIDSSADNSPQKACSIIDLIQEVVTGAGGTFFLFYDKYQMIQGGSNMEYSLPKCIEDSDCRLSLHCNCRNTKEIAKTSVTPLRDSRNKAIKPTTACSWFEPVKPKLHVIEEKDNTIKVLNGILDSYNKIGIKDVVILTSETMDYSALADHVVAKDSFGYMYQYEYAGNQYDVTTCIRFKGLEADAIVFLDLNSKSFIGKKGLEFYVGTSRAKLRLDLICTLTSKEYGQIIHDLDENAPVSDNNDRMQKILGNLFSAEVICQI